MGLAWPTTALKRRRAHYWPPQAMPVARAKRAWQLSRAISVTRHGARFRWLSCLLVVLTFGGAAHFASAACTSGACVQVGPRLASVSTSQGTLLNTLLGGLTGSTLNLTVADWNAIAVGTVSLANFVNALQTSTAASTPANALNTNVSIAQAITAMANAATADGNPMLAAALNALSSSYSLLPGSIKVGDLLQTTGGAGTATLNALDLVSGVIQLYNYNNVATTPTPITVSGASLGLGGSLANISIAAQVIEPPVYVCGSVGSQFHTAAIRVKLNIDLLTLNPNAGALTAILGVVTVSIGHLDLYVEVARANGTITAVNALAGTLTAQATPGVVDLYLGYIDDAVFFNRSHALVAGDVQYGNIGSLQIGATTIAIRVKSSATGQSPSATALSFSGPYPETKTAFTGASFVSNLLSSLIANVSLSISPSLGALTDALVLPILKTIVTGAISPVLSTILSSVANPLLELLGIRLGEVDVTAAGAFSLCTVSGVVYSDANHNSLQELSESGSGQTLYAKIFSTANGSGPAFQTAAINTTTGAFSFTNVPNASYTVVIDNNNTTTDRTGTLPTGWIATEVLTLTRSVTLTASDITNQSFGIYNGSKLLGVVFTDNGAGGGTANNGTKESGEAPLAGVTVLVTNSAASTTYDTAVSGSGGSYMLWLPASAGAASIKITAKNLPSYVSTGGEVGTTSGTFDRASDTTTFTNVIGTTFTGINFGDVPSNVFEPDGQQTILPGQAAFYQHAYTAGSAGSVSFAGVATGNAWAAEIYGDPNCNGVVDSGEVVLSGATVMSSSQKLCLLVKVFAPVTAPYGTQSSLTLTASFTYANSGVPASHARSDLTVAGDPTSAGLVLTKTVDRATAKSGDPLVYTITYTNRSSESLSTLKIFDATPAYTVFSHAACGSLPSGISACSLAAQPAVGAAGSVQWNFTGSLTPSAVGSVTFTVVVQ